MDTNAFESEQPEALTLERDVGDLLAVLNHTYAKIPMKVYVMITDMIKRQE